MTPASARTHVRQRSRRGEGDKLRDEILDAAETLLHRVGDSDSVSIRMITDAVGCTAPSIYRHFQDKATLLYSVAERLFNEMHSVLAQRCAGIDDPVEALCTMAHAYLDFGIERPEAYKVMFLTSGTYSTTGHALGTLAEAAVEDPTFASLTAMVRAIMDAGIIRQDDPLQVAVDLWTIVHGVTVHAVVASGYFPYPAFHEELDRLIAITMKGLAP